MKVLLIAAITAALGVCEVATAAEPPEDEASFNLGEVTKGYSYFNRPAATVAAHNEALAACAADASTVGAQDQEAVYAGQGALVGLIGGILQDRANAGAQSATLENCMVVRGWRVVALPDEEGAALAALPASDLSLKLEPWIGSPTPHGSVVKVWENQALNASIRRFKLHPRPNKDGSLSLKLAAGDAPKAEPVAEPPREKIKLDPTWPKKLIKLDAIQSARPDAGVIVFRIRGLSLRNGSALEFGREGPDRLTAASLVDHRPDRFSFTVGTLFAKKEGDWALAVVSPGRWRISSIGGGYGWLNFCFGAPAFEVGAGEVVYAGTFDFSTDFVPDLNLEPAASYLAGTTVGAKLRAAVYMNGSAAACGDGGNYALEIPGAPYKPDYHWAGAPRTE